MSYFEVAIRVATINDKGAVKKHTEYYLVDAMSPTIAEAMVTEAGMVSGQYDEIIQIKKSRILEIVK